MRFPGQYYDSESGLCYNYRRYYDPNIGKYISVDPLNADLNLYLYGYVNPIRFIDPLGLFTVNDFSDAVAGFGDTISFGISKHIRDLIANELDLGETVNQHSWYYKGGEVAGVAYSMAMGAAGGAKAAVKGWSHYSHSFLPKSLLKRLNGNFEG